jgi:HEAT repeat protein
LAALDDPSGKITGAAARLLAVRRPDGAAETLTAFLPYAENESVIEDVKTALSTVSYRDGKPDAALVKALGDEQPLRRAVAVEVLCQAGIAEPRATLRKLLKDPVPVVRFQAGLVLAQANDAEAVTAMIGVLSDLPLSMARQVEDYLYTLAGDQGPKQVSSTDAAVRVKQRDAWKAWWEANDGSAALAEFRKRTLTESERAKGMRLIELLGDDEYDTRQKASADVLAQGPNMLPLLRANLKHPDLEIRRRVRDCLEAIQDNKTTPLPLTAPRMLAVRKPEGAVAVMLDYLPAAEDSTTAGEIQTALNALAYIDGKPDATLVKALEDKIAARRAAAVISLSQAPTDDVLRGLRKLLKDPDPPVRLQAALGLAWMRDRDAVPVLIALLGELAPEQADEAEDYLRRLAGERPPAMPDGASDSREKRRDAWQSWWKENGSKIEMVARLAPGQATRFLNYTVLVQPNNGMVSEIGPDGKVRWQITGLQNTWDAQVLPGDHVLITEYNQRRVTERNFKGEIIWEKSVQTWPIGAQRLPNGHTLVAAHNQIIEVDRAKKEIVTINRQFNDIMTAGKTRDGQIVCITSQGTCIRYNAEGKEVKSFHIQQVGNVSNEVLPNGNILVAALYVNKVIEYDPEGKEVWSANVTQPLSVSRMPNGHTLVVPQQWPSKLIELDRQGKQVAEMAMNTYVQKARKR